MNRALSIRNRNTGGTSSSGGGSNSRQRFSFASLRGNVQPELSRKLYRLIKSENNLITAHETAGRERVSIATQLSEWGEQTGDESISDVSDKVGVVLSEVGEQEDTYAHALDDSRGLLKTIRNIEKSVQPSRDNKARITDEISKLKLKEPQSTRLVVLEQELVRAEAENLVAEAQLTNVTRQKLKESYNAEFLATIERAEKQIILARHGMRLLKLLDDTPVVPGDVRPAYEGGLQARQILNDAEDDLRDWRPDTTLVNEEVSPARRQRKVSGDSYSTRSQQAGLGPDGFAAQSSRDPDTEYVRENVGHEPQDVRQDSRETAASAAAPRHVGSQSISNYDRQRSSAYETVDDPATVGSGGERRSPSQGPSLPEVQRSESLGLPAGFSESTGDVEHAQPQYDDRGRTTMLGTGQLELPEAQN